MRLSIRHQTRYTYDSPVLYSIQQIRLTPNSAPTQFVANWDLSVPGKLNTSLDAYGNTLQTLVLTRPITEMTFTATGEVETTPLQDGRLLEGPGRIPLEHFTCTTPLTEVDPAILDLANTITDLKSPSSLVNLAQTIRGKVSYQTGSTEVTGTAAEALAQGKGVCQDHAHLFIACCRARNLPARYVSGYLETSNAPEIGEQAASHAWVDVWLDDCGWISVDVTQGQFASEQYCRLAVGRDYAAAAPLRGMRVGGGNETLSVDVSVQVVVKSF
jgi:transglutaminase-like putative cysteine protease